MSYRDKVLKIVPAAYCIRTADKVFRVYDNHHMHVAGGPNAPTAWRFAYGKLKALKTV